MTKDELDKYKELEFVVEKLVDYCNNTEGMATACELIAVEAALERLYKARQPESERNIIRLAQDAGAATGTGSILFRLDGSLERFFNAAYAAGAKDEREACSKAVERARLRMDGSLGLTHETDFIATRITDFLAAQIRARGGEK